MVASKQIANVVPLNPRQSLSRSTAEPGNRLAKLKKSEYWDELSRPAQRALETRENQATALRYVGKRFEEEIEESGGSFLATIVTTMRDWQEQIDAVGDAISDEERDALLLSKSNELAALLQARQTSRDSLSLWFEEASQEIMSRPAHEWVKPTFADQIEDLLTGGEAELARRGLPPLSFWQSLLNGATFGMVADKAIRDAERARLLPQPTGMPDAEGVIDADYTIQ